MAMVRRPQTSATAARQAPGFLAEIGEMLQSVMRVFHDTYRPELHYMRGPGPKWHAKHDVHPAQGEAIPVLLRVKR